MPSPYPPHAPHSSFPGPPQAEPPSSLYPLCRHSGDSRNPAVCLSFKCRAFTRPSGERVTFPLLVQRKVTERKHTPSSALSGHPALRVREGAAGFVERTSLCAQRTGAHRARPPSDFSSAPSPRHRGPISAASCRRSNSSGSRLLLLRQFWSDANDRVGAVEGSTDSCTTGAVCGAEHRRRGGKLPAGSRRWIAAIAKQYKDVLSEQPRLAEKRRAVRFARCVSDRRVRCLAFLVTLWALRRRSGANRGAGRGAAQGRMPGVMPKSNRLAAGETKLCTSKDKAKTVLDSGVRRKDELKKKAKLKRERYSATARDCIPR